MTRDKYGRRRFLTDSAALVGVTASGMYAASAGAALPGRPPLREGDRLLPYEQRSRHETASILVGPGGKTPLQDLQGSITPNALHYEVSHGMRALDIDPQEYRLMVHGLVDRPLIFTLNELKRLPSVSRVHFLMCAGSSYVTLAVRQRAKTVQDTHGWTSCSEWTGVPLSIILKEAGLKSSAKWVVAEDYSEKWTVSIPLEKVMDDAMLVYGQNGEAVFPMQGYPVRMLVPGFEGTRNTKWLRRIKVTDKPYMTKWETSVYTNLHPDGKGRWFQFQLEPNSVVTFPSGEQRLEGKGFYEITGLAWSGGGAIHRVEVSTDGGRHWHEAQIQQPAHPKAHTRFRFPWYWDGKEAVIQSRCMDDQGDIQPTLAEMNKIWGVNTDFWLSKERGEHRIQHLNMVQPWKLMRDGSVHNALWDI